MGKNSTRNFAKKQESFRNTQRENSKLALGLGAGATGVLALVGQARATIIHDFGELMEPGYTAQSLTNAPNYDFTVEGQTPILDYHFGFLDSSGHVVGYLNSYPGYPDYLTGAYNGDPSGTNPNVLHVGEKPANAIVIEDTNENGVIADLTAGNLTIDAGDRLWLTNDIEFNSVQGGISEMRAYTGSGTLTVPSINLIPEPLTLSIIAIGAAMMLGRKAKGLVGKLIKK